MSGAIQIEIPESILAATGKSPQEFISEARFLLALKLFETDRLSSGKAPEFCASEPIIRSYPVQS